MKKNSSKYSGILLAGGKSSRMGEDKAFIKFGDRYLYEYSLSVLKKFSGDILLSSSNPRFDHREYERTEDEILNLGPIGGIYSCLKKIKCNSAIVLPCDLPLINRKIIELIIAESADFQITVALNPQNLPEPLIGIYSISVVPVIEKMIRSQNYKLQDLLKKSKSNLVKIPEAYHETFININSPGDYNQLSTK